jgi:predicted dehydrogenase
MTTAKIRWGILSTANIGLKKVIPAMQLGALSTVTAIASRDLAQAQKAAAHLGIAKAYGSYEALLADPDIDAIYNPLPNDLHVPWTIKSAEAGKHVLCEKPIGLNAEDARQLIAVRERTGVKIGEAFMVRLHPQWLRTRALIDAGRIGNIHLVQGAFSYFNVKPENIRNSLSAGGGALMDIGCYLVFLARFIFQQEPTRVLALIDRDPGFGTDRLTSFLLDFPGTGGPAQAIASCSTQLVPHQRVQIFGSKGRIEIQIPVNTPPDRATNLFLDDGSDVYGANITTETFPAVDQYTLQGDAFSKAILDDTEIPVPLEEAIKNMAVIDALFRSAESNSWERL